MGKGLRPSFATLLVLGLVGFTAVAPQDTRAAAAAAPAARSGPLVATSLQVGPAAPRTVPTTTQTEPAPEPTCDETTLPPADTVVAKRGQTVRLAHDAADLEVGPDVVNSDTTMESRSLCQPSMAPLDQGMTNVTAGPRRGYRFLPNGAYRNNMRVSLPYDPALIPAGLTDQDVRTFYYDELSTSWRALDRVSIDGETKTVHSLTDHFTDFINATVTVPDHPETFSHNPTTIKDIKAADPGASVNLIDVPQSNNGGDARLAYPLEFPPGRNGMAPRLGLRYDSGGGNGWLGVGWDLAAPSVSIETRWGVPRYSATSETETYTLNGEQLTPVAHRGVLQARTAEKVFHNRVEGQFRRIIRHGTGPADYWWEVTEKDGTRSFYGGNPETGALATDSVLADGAGNVYRWALRETRDLNGNAVRYSYVTVTDAGVAGGTVAGRQLYLKTINYTRSATLDGAYTVTLVRDSELPGYTRRPDVVINARGGFKMVTAELLAQIRISFNGTPVRQYDLGYVEGAFHKTLLRSVTQRGGSGVVFNTHTFQYYDDLRDGTGAYNGFSAATTWATGNDGVTAGLLDHGQATALGGSLNTSVGGHLYVGFNPTAPTKQFSAGAKVGFNFSSNDGVLAMVDLNGDSLPDKVFRQGGGIAFRLNTSGPDGSTDFAGGTQGVPTLPGISEENSDMFSFGGEVYVVANVFLNHSTTFTTTSVYFSDVNGDGLPDLVDGGRVLFNHLGPGGVPTFTENSADTPVPVDAGLVDTTGIADDFDDAFQAQIDNYPLADTLRRWQAPFTGRVRITGDVALIEDTGPARDQYQRADGVRVAIEQDSAELWSTVITGDDYAAKTPTGVDSIQVDRGDHLYFRVQSRFDGAFDQVSWQPQIAYLDVTAVTDVNNLDAYTYRAAQDFVLAGRRGASVTVPFNGTVRLAGELRKTGPTTDDIEVLVLKNGVPVFTGGLLAGETAILAVNTDIAVARDDSIQLRVQVDSPIDVSRLAWTPRLFYVATPDVSPIVDAGGNPTIQLHPPYDVDIYPVNGLTAPQQAWPVPADDTVTVTPQLSAAGGANGTVTFTVKKRGVRLAKRTITITNGVVSAPAFDLAVTAGDELFFDFSVYDPELAGQLGGAAVDVDGDTVPSAVHAGALPGLLALPYRGWTYAGYNGNRDRALAPIVEADLEQTFDENSTYDPRTAKAYLFTPFPEDTSWRGPDERGWVKSTTMSSSRLGRDTITVPRPEDFAGARAVQRLSETSQTAVGGGVSFLSGSASTGSTTGKVDYLDLNGDRFPDIVSEGRVQFTTPTGGLSGANQPVSGLGGAPRDSDATAINVGVGGSPAAFFADGGGEVDPSGKGAPTGNTTGSQMAPLGLSFSAGLGRGDSTPRHDLLDVNGDGLPDRVSGNGSSLSVALNLGYAFAQAEPWGTAAINDGASENGSIGVSLGFNAGIYDFAGGASLSKNKSQASETLLDLNGDGLLDRVLPGGSGLRVGFNTGNGFTPPVGWGGAMNGACEDDTSIGLAGIDWNQVRTCSGTTGLGGGAYFTIGIGPLCLVACYIILNPGADASQNMAREEAALRDVDGDGNADHVASTDDSSMRVARNNTGRTNLLKSVSRPLGATINLEYQRDGNTVDSPHSRWVLAKSTLTDGHPGDGVDTQVTTFTYEDGFYNRNEREFYGYRKVTETHRDAANGLAAYRNVVFEYRTDSYYTRGLPTRILTTDAAGRLFNEVAHTYLLRDTGTGVQPADGGSTTAAIFPQLIRTDKRFYEGTTTASVSTFTTQEYDALGNVVTMVDAADSGTQDDSTATVTYSSCVDSYVVGLPTSIRVVNGSTELRRREATVECATGDVTQIRQYLADGTAAVTDMEYFADGNLRRVTGPVNHNGQRHQLSYEYDPTVQTYVQKVTDSYGLVSTSTHDLRYGTMSSATDPNNNRTTYVYDDIGRMTSVTGPYEQGGATATIRFDYHPEAAVPWARTRHLDSFRSPTDTIDTVLFIDGLKRILQTKKDVTVHTGQDTVATDVMSVSGRVTFDHVGRTVSTAYPVTEPLGTPGVFHTAADSVQPTRMTYDVLNRATSVTLPDGTNTTTAYGFGQDRVGASRFATTVTDANGIQKRTFRDVRQFVTSLQEFHNGQSVWTSYVNDAMGQLVEVRDDQNNRTAAGYDNLGRRTALETPDTGRTETVYDLASNPTARITATLRAQNKQITFGYDFTRLLTISYPDFPQNNVTYTYGAPGATDNRAGRLTVVTDESGREDRFYGKLGEITKEIKSIASDTGPEPEVYTTQYTYDTFGRLQTLIYPDNEVLTYQYDSGGLVRAASGVKGSHTYQYVNRLEYDKFEQRAFIEAGNNVRTTYTYDAIDRRLNNLTSGKSGGNPIQNLNYGYDNVGNILSLSNDVPVPPPSRDGGPTTQTFAYDDLYRLTSANGTYEFAPDKFDRYRLTLAYNSIHNMVGKDQTHEIVEPSGTVVPQHKTSYTFAYAYDSTQPHAADHIGQQTFRYDVNGNQTGWTDDVSGQRRDTVWDEENRIQSLFDNGHEKTYKYDDTGERVIKRGPQGETAYVNQFFTMRNREIGTKHVLVGTTRLVSKLMMQDKPGSGPPGNQPLEKDRYFFHADHLGSSNYVTDSNGEIFQHTEYFPGGETWVDESGNKQRTPYLFSGKELDEETGLYYYGARYYDPRTGAWQSADVQVDRYLSGLTQGGVYNSFNLNLYSYGYQNPVKYADPNGKWVETAWDVFNIGLGVVSLVDNVRQGNYGSAALDAVGVVADTVAAVVPVVPGGVGTAIKAARAADAGIDAVKAIDKTVDVVKATDKALDAAKTVERGADVAPAAKKLLPGELDVGTYDKLRKAGTKGDDITPHHIPSDNHMAQHGVSKKDGIAINMEHPHPGSGGRHRETFTYGTQADVNMSPRDALAAGVRDARKIYQKDGLYGPEARGALQEVIKQNKQTFPEIFAKPKR